MTLYNPSSLASRMSESLESHSLMRESILGPIYETKSLWFCTLRLLLNSTMFCRCILSSFFFAWLSEFEFSATCNCSSALMSFSREAILKKSKKHEKYCAVFWDSRSAVNCLNTRFTVELLICCRCGVFPYFALEINTFEEKNRLFINNYFWKKFCAQRKKMYGNIKINGV